MAGDNSDRDLTTQVVHAGERLEPPRGKSVSTPIYATATFTYDSMTEADQVLSGAEHGYIYTRFGNPTTAALEAAIKSVEAGGGACAYSSGMAALHAALFACELSPGATVLASQDLYGATINLLYTIFGAFEVKTVTADFSDVQALRATAREVRPRAMIAETISNPLLKICDIEACAELAHEVGARLIIDNTFATPYLCQPLKLGADFVVHSLTKYIGGHGDATGGITVARDEIDVPALVGVMKLVGGVLSVWEAHEILRGLKTLAVRLERQCANARLLAEHLQNHPGVARVYYPGLADRNDETIQRVLRPPHAGALVSLELAEGTTEAAFRFMNKLELCVRSTSLGDVFTGALHPATASHREIAPARRRQLGISDGLVRLSIGIEDARDIIADVEQALQASG